jgi:hypothetical protein
MAKNLDDRGHKTQVKEKTLPESKQLSQEQQCQNQREIAEHIIHEQQ